jgi:hypothetical protein
MNRYLLIDNTKRTRKRKGEDSKPHLQGHVQDHTFSDSTYLHAAKRHTSAARYPVHLASESSSHAFEQQAIPDMDQIDPEVLEPTETVRKRKGYQNAVIMNSPCASRSPISYTSQRYPLLAWIPLRQNYLDACLTQDGRGKHVTRCIRCSSTNPEEWARCETCFGRGNYCRNCVLQMHWHEPLHNLKVCTAAVIFTKVD